MPKLFPAALVLLLPFAVSAQEQDVFAIFDANSDEMISEEEAQADPNLVAIFTQADTNQDGVLDRAEFEAVLGPG